MELLHGVCIELDKIIKTDLFISKLYNILVEEIEPNISIDDLIEFLRIQSMNKNNIITEEIRQCISLPENLLMLIEANLTESCTLSKISGEDIFNCFEDKTIFKTNNFPNIIICKLDFFLLTEWEKFILLMTQELTLSEKQLYALNIVRIHLKSVSGLFTDFNKFIDANLLLFDSTKYNKRTIEHELTHYLQKYTKYGLSKINIKSKHFDYSKFNYLKLSEDSCKYIFNNIFNKKEFIPTIDNLIFNLNNIYNKFYKDKVTELEFITEFQTIFNSKNSDVIFNSDIYNYWQQLKYSTVPLYLYAMLKDLSPQKYAKVNLKLCHII